MHGTRHVHCEHRQIRSRIVVESHPQFLQLVEGALEAGEMFPQNLDDPFRGSDMSEEQPQRSGIMIERELEKE